MAFYVCGLKSHVQTFTNSQPVLCFRGEERGEGLGGKGEELVT